MQPEILLLASKLCDHLEIYTINTKIPLCDKLFFHFLIQCVLGKTCLHAQVVKGMNNVYKWKLYLTIFAWLALMFFYLA